MNRLHTNELHTNDLTPIHFTPIEYTPTSSQQSTSHQSTSLQRHHTNRHHTNRLHTNRLHTNQLHTKRPPLHPQWAEWQPYGGKPSAEVSRIFISPHYSFAQCAPNGRHCTHSGPNGSHMGGNLVSKSREFLLLRTTHSPDSPQTAATAPTVGRMAAIGGQTYHRYVPDLYLSPRLIHPMRPKRPPLHPQWAEWQPYGGKA